MDIRKILTEYDGMFGKKSLEEIETYLNSRLAEAKQQGEKSVTFTLLNEVIGFYRDTTQKEKALERCLELKALLKELQLEGRLEYATSLLNIANAYRAFGLLEESESHYREAEQVYVRQLQPGDFGFANLYNNWSLLCQEKGEYGRSCEMLRRALLVVNAHEEAAIPQATTRTNLAATLLQVGTREAYEEAVCHLQEALKIFEADGGQDFHYGAALVALGDAYCFQKDYKKAAESYGAGLREIEKHVGRTENYARVEEKYYFAKSFIEEHLESEGNLERCRRFYEQYGRPMIHREFPDYEERIAVGMVGEGSDCYGFDDEISQDHDYGLGFCMWLTAKDYAEIGSALQEAYEHILAGSDLKKADPGRNVFLAGRRGVFSIQGFYSRLLGGDWNPENPEQWGQEPDWLAVEEWCLAQAVNGQVFRDDLGLFTQIRQRILSYYPESVRRQKIALCLHEFSQYAQSNYARMMGRGDVLTAELCAAKGIEAAMDLVYLLMRRYAPYYKWKRKGLEVAELGQRLLAILDGLARLPVQQAAWEGVSYNAARLNFQDEKIVLFEKVAALLLEELNRQGLVNGKDLFLEQYVGQLKNVAKEEVPVDYVEQIVELEWQQFDKVKNEGGRADCQDDFGTFSIMRKSQYMAWPEELLVSYYGDLASAQEKGWNLITEKYARMMKSTAPEQYARLEKELPVRSEQRTCIQEEIVKIQVQWMEEFAEKYPKMAENARSIRTEEDSPYNTSYETYLRGELGTYSENTFVLYGRFIAELLGEGRNLAYEIMDNTARLYGYASVEDAEARLS